jgi:hypothetical protein
MLNLATEINLSGIVLEIVGFVLVLYAVRAMPNKNGGFTTGIDDLVNVMSTIHPSVNMFGIILVIAGLVLQLVNSLVS